MKIPVKKIGNVEGRMRRGIRATVLVLVTAAAAAAQQPVIRASSGILNANGYQAQLAPDTVFVIFGTGLGPASLQQASAPNYSPSLAGTSVKFTPVSGGTAINAGMVYTVATQVAGVLPSSITPGTYAVTVTYNTSISAPQNVTVVARSFGIATSNSGGTGPAQATIGNVNNGISLVRMTGGSINFSGYDWTLSPAHPGDELVLWGTGGGADRLNDTGGTSGDQTAAGNFTVTVDGMSIVPLYAGASAGYPGLWQINFVLPSNITSDCLASVQVSAGGQVSNPATIAIADPGAASCSSTISKTSLSTLDGVTGSVTFVGLGLAQQIQNGVATTPVGGLINKYSVAEFLLPYSGPKVDQCLVLQEAYSGKDPVAADQQLDAGTLTVSGGGQTVTIGKNTSAAGPVYSGSIATVPGATYTLTATGGADVGPFTASATFPNSFTVTNLSALNSIDRSQPLTINWTGSGFDHVAITIETENIGKTIQVAELNCTLPAGLGTYTIPVAALQYLIPAASVSTLRVQSEHSSGTPTSADSNMDPNSIVSLTGGALADFGFFGTSID
jgi:uncharacterized protein (TIGR03437 family)